MQQSFEQRDGKRIGSKGFTIDIANGRYAVDGYIDDISVDGIKVTQLSDEFLVNNSKYVTVIIGINVNFKVEVQPCWVRKSPGGYQEVGFKIVNPPKSWKSFLQSMSPEQETA